MTPLFGVLLYKFDLYEVGSQLNILQAESLFFVMTAFNQSTIKIFVYNNLIKAYFLTQVLSDARELSPVSKRIRIFWASAETAYYLIGERPEGAPDEQWPSRFAIDTNA